MPLTFAMIRVVRKDRCRPEQLLGEHRTHQQVRPGRRTEGQQQVGGAALLLLMTVRRADHEASLALSAVAPLIELFREIRRAERLPALVEDNRDGARRKFRDLSSAVGQLGDLGRPGDSLQIAVDEISLG